MKRLKATPIFPREDLTQPKSVTPPPIPPKTDGTSSESPTPPPPTPVKRYPANTLYAPSEVHAALGLPVIEWKVNNLGVLQGVMIIVKGNGSDWN